MVIGGGLRSVGKSHVRDLLVEAGYVIEFSETMFNRGNEVDMYWKDELLEDSKQENKYFTPKRREVPSTLFSKTLENIKEN